MATSGEESRRGECENGHGVDGSGVVRSMILVSASGLPGDDDHFDGVVGSSARIKLEPRFAFRGELEEAMEPDAEVRDGTIGGGGGGGKRVFLFFLSLAFVLAASTEALTPLAIASSAESS